MKTLFGVLRLVAAVAIVAAVTRQLVSSLRDPNFFFFDFFGFFTIQSNLIIAVAFVLGAVWVLRSKLQPEWLVVVRGAAATYLATTGIVYNLLLANGSQGAYNVEWTNNVLHRIVPVFAVLEWVFFGDRTRIRFSRLWIFLVYPIVWLIATLLRGQSFVPYPFLDAAKLGGGVVALYCVGIAAFIALMSAIVIWLSRFHLLIPDRLAV